MNRKSPEYITALHASIQRGMLWCILLLFVQLSLFGAFFAYERQLEEQARANQEASVQW